MTRLALLALILLASCGAEGAPTPPGPQPAMQPGVSIHGTARAGIKIS